MASALTEPIERSTAKRRVALEVNILKGETSVAEAAPKHGLTGAVSGRGGERPAESSARRSSIERRADQKVETEDRKSGPR